MLIDSRTTNLCTIHDKRVTIQSKNIQPLAGFGLF
jgi:histone H3/H4